MTQDPPDHLASAPVFDHQGLLDFWNQQAGVAERVLSAYIQTINSYHRDMCRAVAARDVAAVRFACHKLTGSSATVRADQIAAICGDIRSAAIAQEFSAADQLLVRLKTAFADFLVVVGAEFPSLQEKIRHEVQLG